MKNYEINNNSSIKNFEKSDYAKEQFVDTLSKKGRKNPLIWKTLLLVVGLAVFALWLVFGVMSSTVSAYDYMKVTYDGVNGAGTVITNLDKVALLESVIGKEPEGHKIEEFVEWQIQYDEYMSGISISCDKTESLCNGDTVTVTISISGVAESKIKGGSKTYTVYGLLEVDTIDVFENLTCEIKGINGSGSITLKNNSENEFVKLCGFSVDKSNGLSNGDEVIVTVSYEMEDAKRLGYAPAASTQKITVSGLKEYVEDGSQIPKEKITKLANQLIKEISAEEDDFIFSRKNIKYYATYFGVAKDDSMFAANNILHIYVSYDEYMRGEFNKTIYVPLKFKNILIDTDGNVELDYDSGSSAAFTTDMDASLEDLKEDYTISKIY